MVSKRNRTTASPDLPPPGVLEENKLYRLVMREWDKTIKATFPPVISHFLHTQMQEIFIAARTQLGMAKDDKKL